MAKELEQLKGADETQALSSDAQQVLDLLSHSEDSYIDIGRMLASYFAAFPAAWGAFVIAVGQQVVEQHTPAPTSYGSVSVAQPKAMN